MPKIYLKQGGIVIAIALTLSIILYFALSFSKQDIQNFTSQPLIFLKTPRGYASILIASLWAFGLMALFLPIFQSAIMVDDTDGWDPEYPLWKEDFRKLESLQGVNHPALMVVSTSQAAVQEASSIAKVILAKKDEAKLDEVVASLQEEQFDESIEQKEESKIEEKKIEIPPTQSPNSFMSDF